MGYFKASNPWNSPYGLFSIGKNLLNACAEGHSLSKKKLSFSNLSNKLTPLINQHFLSHRCQCFLLYGGNFLLYKSDNDIASSSIHLPFSREWLPILGLIALQNFPYTFHSQEQPMNNFSQHHSHIVKQEVKRRQKKINFVIQIDWTQNSQSYIHMKSM